MGQMLSEPVTAKKSACCRDVNYRVGSSCMQGWRIKMEDCHVHILSLPDDPDAAFFAVYDGHGGAAMAQYAGKHLHEYITGRPEYKEGRIEEAMKRGFLELDKVMQTDDEVKNEQAGTTVIAILIKDNVLYSANAGDSRAVASVAGAALPLSHDHKPMLKEEKERIVAAGGWVEFNRVNGHLALSRALGDFMFKKNERKKPEEQIVSALPEIQRHAITEDWEFVILACDGIWDVMSSKEVIDFVRRRFADAALPAAATSSCPPNSSAESTSDASPTSPPASSPTSTTPPHHQPTDPEEICEQLINHCLAPDALMGTGCDNMTVVLVALLHAKPYSQMLLRCRRPAQQRTVMAMDGQHEDGEEEEEDMPSDENNAEREDDEDGDEDVK